MLAGLKSIYIIERDNTNTLFSWSFPQHDQNHESLLFSQCGLQGSTVQHIGEPIISRFNNSWQYMYSEALPLPSDDNTTATNATQSCCLTHVSIILSADQYNYDAFISLCKLFVRVFIYDRTSIRILPLFLGANANNYISTESTVPEIQPSIEWSYKSYDPRHAVIASTDVLVSTFGLESVLIWITVLLKLRLCVYGQTPRDVIDTVRSIPSLGGWHRQNYSMLCPFITNFDADNGAMKSYILQQPGCIYGTTAQNAASLVNLWDIYIDLTNKSIIINSTSKSLYTLTKYHKTVAEALISTVNSFDDSMLPAQRCQAVIKAAMLKTKELLDLVSTCKDENGYVSHESIAEKGIPANMQSFLYRVAAAEGLIEL